MDKFAQKRTWMNKLHEMGNFSGKAAEKFFNPEFLKVMTALRKIDNNIRSIAAGESLGTEKDPLLGEDVPGDPGSDHTSLKELSKSAKTNFNRREYMQAAADLGRFHAKMMEINKQIDSLETNVDEVHHQFLFKHLTDGHDKETQEDVEKRLKQVEHLKSLQERWSKSSSQNANSLTKEASIVDFFINLTTPRGKALAAYEKRFPDKVKVLKAETEKQIAATERMLSIVIAELKVMASLRASRKPDDYLKEAGKIKKAYLVYDAGFKKYYESQIKGFLEKMFSGGASKLPDPSAPTPGPGSPTTPTSANLTVPDLAPPTVRTPFVQHDAPPEHATVHQVPDLVVPQPVSPPAAVSPPSAPLPVATQTETAPVVPDLDVPPESRIRVVDPNAKLRVSTTTHKNFYESLEAMSNESPLMLAKYISRYASHIQHSDPDTAINLLKIATRIKG